MSRLITMQEWESFVDEATNYTNKQKGAARLEVVNQSQNGLQVAVIAASFKNKENDVVRYEENVGYCTDPNAVVSEKTQQQANEELKQLAEDTRHKRSEMKQQLEELGFSIREGLYA